MCGHRSEEGGFGIGAIFRRRKTPLSLAARRRHAPPAGAGRENSRAPGCRSCRPGRTGPPLHGAVGRSGAGNIGGGGDSARTVPSGNRGTPGGGDREPPATLRIGSRCPAPDMTRRKGHANSTAHPAVRIPPPVPAAGADVHGAAVILPSPVTAPRSAPARRPGTGAMSAVTRPAGTVMRDGDVRRARTRQDGNALPMTAVSGDRVDPGAQACGREDGRQGSASRSLAIPAVAIFAGWRFRLKGRRKPDLAHRHHRKGDGAARGLRPGGHVAVPLQDAPCRGEAALDALMHPAAGVVVFLDLLRLPEAQRVVALRESFGLHLQRQQKLTVPVPRARPGRGAGNPDQTSSMRATSRSSTRRSPPSSGNTVPAGRRTGTDTPGRSILSSSAPSARRSPESVASPSAASRTSGGVSRVTRPSTTPARAQKGASGSAAWGSSHAAMPQDMAARSAGVWSRTGNGARSGSPGCGRRRFHALRYALLARMKRQARKASHPPTRRATVSRSRIGSGTGCRRAPPPDRRPCRPVSGPGRSHRPMPWLTNAR